MKRSILHSLCSLTLCLTASVAVASGGAVKGYTKIATSLDAFTASINAGDGFGLAIAEIADLDGDGVRELAVGASTDDAGSTNPDLNTGAVWILFMNADGTVKPSPAPQRLPLPGGLPSGGRFGSSIASIGNLGPVHQNAIAIGVPQTGDWPDPTRGLLYIASLSYAAGVVTPNYLLMPPPRTGLYGFGNSIIAIADLDSDGIPELAIGAPVNPSPNTHQGAVVIAFLNSDRSLKGYKVIGRSAVADAGSAIPLSNLEEFGASLAWLGDLDGSHQRVLVVGAPQNNGATPKFYVVSLNGVGGLAAYSTLTNGVGGVGDVPGNVDFLSGGPLVANDLRSFALLVEYLWYGVGIEGGKELR